MELLIVTLWAIFHAVVLIYFEVRLNREQREMLVMKQRREAYLKSLGFDPRLVNDKGDYIFWA